jgi:predicted DNA-binding transcriptional regulator AlpA
MINPLPQDKLVARIVDGVSSRLTATPKDANRESKPYLREKEAAQYMGVSVFALRSWRTKRSNNGPPYTRLGRMVLYRVSEIDEHMRTRMIQQAMVRSA